jgi:hypothetical protein
VRTVIVRWFCGPAGEIRALRDELISRPFDDRGR